MWFHRVGSQVANVVIGYLALVVVFGKCGSVIALGFIPLLVLQSVEAIEWFYPVSDSRNGF